MLDSFTASTVLNVLTKDNSDEIASLVKELSSYKGGATPEAIEWFVKNEGNLVTIKHTPYTGIVHKLNKATCGFYEGERYPIYVKITEVGEGDERALGRVFEYGLDFLTLVEGFNHEQR